MKTIQAKHLPDADVLIVVDSIVEAQQKRWPGFKQAVVWEIYERLPAYPWKVVLAKLRSMVRRGVLDAQCTCGCKGPYCRPEHSPWGGYEQKVKTAKQ